MGPMVPAKIWEKQDRVIRMVLWHRKFTVCTEIIFGRTS